MLEKIYFMTHTRLDSFIVGIILAEYYLIYNSANSFTKKIKFLSPLLRNCIAILLLINIVFILFGTYWKNPLINYVLKYNWYNLTAFLLGFYFLNYESLKDWFIRLFSFNIYIPISKISYTVFLFHEYIIMIFAKNFKIINLSSIDDVKLFKIIFIGILVSIIFGYIFYLLFEKPFHLIKEKS